MTEVEAFGHFARRADRDIWPGVAQIDGHDVWPAAMAACVSLAGMLDEAADDASLDEGVGYCSTLMDIGVVNSQQLCDETVRVLGLVMDWGDKQCVGMGVERN